MELVFLGTSAGEQYPGFWCRCENCEKARKLGGRNIRKNSCAWISPDCLIDLPAEVFMQAERFHVPIIDARILLVTHSHEDHFFPYLLCWRRMKPGTQLPPDGSELQPRFSEIATLQVIGNKTVCDKVRKYLGDNLAAFALEVKEVNPFQSYVLGEMEIIPLLANHPDGEEKGLNYIIKKEGKTILYGLDTGWFLPETLSEIMKHRFDLVVLEGTFGYGGEDASAHLNFGKASAAHQLFKKEGILKEESHFCLTHLCPHFSPIHDEIEEVFAEKGVVVAYDGLRMEV